MLQNAAPSTSLFRAFPKFVYALLLLCFVRSAGAAEPPQLFREREFDAAIFAKAVNHFIALGEDAAVKELTELTPDHSALAKGNGKPTVAERVGWVCRVLFSAKKKQPLRPPAYGGYSLPTLPLEKWPLYPIALSGETYFILSEGYSLGGKAEKPVDYLAYCRKNGVFRKEPIAVPTRAQAQKDADALRASPEWQAIKWTDSRPGRTYTMSEPGKWKFIQAQAHRIP